MASSCGASKGEEWAQEVLGRLGGMPNGGVGQPVGGGSRGGGVERSSGRSGGGRRVPVTGL